MCRTLKRPLQCSEQFLELKICVSPQFRAMDPRNPARGFIQQNQNVRLATAACIQKSGNVRFATLRGTVLRGRVGEGDHTMEGRLGSGTGLIYMFYSLNMTRGACYQAFDLFLISMCNIPPIRIHFSWMSRFVWSWKHGPIGCDFVLISSKRWLLQAMPHLQHWQLSLQGRHKAGDTPDHRCVSMNETMENVIFIPKIIGEDHMILVITV